MAVDFASPSFRAASSDLTISISPLGLVELSDEEFEVHGPRLNRYAMAWAFYLGRHWAYRREMGEPQLTFNFTRAFSDFLTSFCFGRGASFKSPDSTAAIVPYLLQRVWEKDNRKDNILWEIGNSGSVTGDAFVKIAYEEAYTTGMTQDLETGEMVPIEGVVQIQVPGKVRIIPLNSAFCFPEFHPHDRNRIIRFKLKYRFWGQSPEGTRQVFTYVEIITETEVSEYVNDTLIGTWPNILGRMPIVHIRNLPISGSPWGMSDINDIMGLNREYNEKATDISDIINYHAAPVTVLTGGRAGDLEKGAKRVWSIPNDKARITNLEISPEGVELALEYLKQVKSGMHEMTGVPEGALGQAQAISNTSGVALAIQYMPLMMRNCNPPDAPIWMGDFSFKPIGKVQVGDEVLGWKWIDGRKRLVKSMVTDLGSHSAPIVRATMMSGKTIRCTADHRWLSGYKDPNNPQTDQWTHVCGKSVDVGEGKKRDDLHTDKNGILRPYRLGTLAKVVDSPPPLSAEQQRSADWLCGLHDGEGTGNTISQSEPFNPEICARIEREFSVLGIPWSKIYSWKDGTRYVSGYKMLGGRQTYVNWLAWTDGVKRKWFEEQLIGGGYQPPSRVRQDRGLYASPDPVESVVPDGEGEVCWLTTTTGNYICWGYASKNSLKQSQYSQGIEEMNKIILLMLYLKEPNSVFLDSTLDVTPRDDAVTRLDIFDQVSYENTVDFQSPLPVDKLVKLNELQLLMAMGLESKVGALTELGIEFPYEKLEELFKELVEDAERQSALDLLKSEAASMTAQQTGFVPGANGPEPMPPPPASGGGGGVTSAGGPGVTGAGAGVSQFGSIPGVDLTDPEDIQKMFSRIVTLAHGTTLANNQKPETDKNDE